MKFRAPLDQLRAFDPPAALNAPAGKAPRLVNLALNENSLGCSPAVVAAVRAAAPELFRYPPTFCGELREKLSGIHGIAPDRFLFGSGIFEILGLITQALVSDGDEVVIPAPSFGWYAITAKAAGARVVDVPLVGHAIDLPAVAAAITPRTRLVWLCNPHNPMGSLVGARALQAWLADVPSDVAVVLDEAYAEYARPEDLPDSAHWLDRHPNLIVLRTFSKAYGLAGLRIGYAMSSHAVISQLHKIKNPPNVGSLAQVAAIAAIDDPDFVRRSVASVRQAVQRYYAFCEARGIGFVPTHTNFIMLDLGSDGDAAAADFLRQGIVIRSGREIGLNNWVRITIGNDDENRRVFALLDDILARTRR